MSLLFERQNDRQASDIACYLFNNNPTILFFPYRLAKLRESGVQFRIRQNFLPSKKPDTETTTIVVSLLTVAPNLVLLVTGNVIGLLILVIERIVYGDVFNIWPLRNIRRKRNNEYKRIGNNRRHLQLHFM
jgi:hypothetical protein